MQITALSLAAILFSTLSALPTFQQPGKQVSFAIEPESQVLRPAFKKDTKFPIRAPPLQIGVGKKRSAYDAAEIADSKVAKTAGSVLEHLRY